MITIAAKSSNDIKLRSSGTQKVVRSLMDTETGLVCVCLVSIDSWKKVWKVLFQGALGRSSKYMKTPDGHELDV